jgi:type I restriction enzyme S subunit
VNSYRPYNSYKPSGLDWVGTVPSHWDVVPLRALASSHRRTLTPHAMASSEVFHYSIPSVQDTGTGAIENGQSIDSNKLEIRSDQLLVSKLNPRKQTIVLARPHPDNRTVASTEFVPLIPKKVELEYLALIFGSEAMRLNLSSKVESVTRSHQRVNPREIENPSIPLPPDSERARIVTQVTASTARIDALIEKKTRFIELLKEKRQALITHAVTKGLDPTVPMKDSGVEWIGEVPAHWSVTRLKFATSRVVDCLHSTPTYLPDGDFPAIRTADITPGHIDLDNARRVSGSTYELRSSRMELRGNDVIYTREGERFGIAGTMPQCKQACLGQRVMAFRSSKEMDSRYLMWSANTLGTYRQAEQDVIGSTSPHVNVETIKNFWLALPPRVEQIAIASWIDREIDKLDRFAELSDRSIDLLKERRSALITAAVTGQIDLREEE